MHNYSRLENMEKVMRLDIYPSLAKGARQTAASNLHYAWSCASKHGDNDYHPCPYGPDDARRSWFAGFYAGDIDLTADVPNWHFCVGVATREILGSTNPSPFSPRRVLYQNR